MIKVMVSCANGAGSSLMIKLKVEKIFKEMGIEASIHHCPISEGKNSAYNYDVVFTALNFVTAFDGAKSKGVKVIGIKNIMSEPEIREKIIANELI